MIKFRATDAENNRTLFGLALTVDDVNGIYSTPTGEAMIYGEEVTIEKIDFLLMIADDHETLQARIKKAFGEVTFVESKKSS
jgi:hypothetical protein